MATIVVKPNEVEPAKKTFPSLTLTLAFPDVFVDAKVRVGVYDKETFERGPLGRSEANASAKGDPLVKFKQDATLTPAELDAKPDGSNGLLLRMDLGLKKTKEPTPRWCSGPPENKMENTNGPPHGSIILRWLQDDLKYHNVGLITYTAAEPTIDDTKFLLFRVAVLSLAQPLPNVFEASVIASNLRKDQNPANGQAVKVNIKAFESLHDALREQLRKGTLDPSKPSVTNRILKPDLTGMYEAFLDPLAKRSSQDNEPVLLFQINQAGHALVGWFTWPPDFTTSSIPDVKPLRRKSPGCFEATLEGTAFPVNWGQSSGFEENLDDPPVPPYPMDLRGSLRIHSQVDRERPELSLVLNADATRSVELFLLRTDSDARWSRSVIDGLINKNIRDNIRANQVRPIPLSFWSLLRSKCQQGSRLSNFIKKWDESTGAPRMSARQSTAQEIINIIGNFKDPHRATIFARFRSNLAQTIIFGGTGHRMTCLEWFREMVKEEMQILVNNPANKALSNEELYALVSRGFRLLGIQPPGQFVYIFDFTMVGAQAGVFVHGGIYGFDVEISRDVKSGDSRSTDKKFNSSTRRSYAGLFGEVGLGISIKGQVGGGSGAPGRVEFDCFHDIEPEDFDGAGFYVEAFNLGKITAVIPTVTLFGALFMQITVPEKPGRPEVVLEGTAAKDPRKPGSKKKFSKVPSVGVEISIAEISFGYGSLLLGKRPLPKKMKPNDDIRKGVVTGKAVRTIDIYFQQDLGTFEEGNRIDLEYRLAVERAMFVNGEGAMQIFGNASPEGTDKRNDNLSEARAAGVEQAIEDAFGADLALKDIEVKGRGSLEATLFDKLLDPPEGRPMKPFELQQVQKEKASWPKYRRVDIIVQQVLAAQVMALGK